MVSGTTNIIKYLLFFFNLIFWLTGIAILAVGIYVQVKFSHFFVFVGTEFLTAPILLIVVGTVIAVIAFFGCCGAARESHCMIMTFSVFLSIIFILQIAAGIVAYAKRSTIDELVRKNVENAISKYGGKDYDTLTKGIDLLQHDFKCCGLNDPFDWQQHSQVIPTSCCKEDTDGCTKKPEQVNMQGCYKKFLTAAKDNIELVGGLAIGIAVIQLIGIIFACCLAYTIRREEEIV